MAANQPPSTDRKEIVTKRLDPVEKELRENVRRGARLLDKYVPGWADKLNNEMKAGRFDITEPERCVVGSLELAQWKYPNTFEEFVIAFNGIRLCNWRETQQYGFAYEGFNPDSKVDEPYVLLDDLWTEQVEMRTGTPVAS